MILIENIFNHVNFLSFAKSDYCLSLTQDSQSEWGESGIFIEKSDLSNSLWDYEVEEQNNEDNLNNSLLSKTAQTPSSSSARAKHL